MNYMIVWKVYEITPDNREHGRLLKTFLTKKGAEKLMHKSIYRYIKEDKVVRFYL